jgi:hypothetical protein
MMFTSEIREALSSNPYTARFFSGVYAADTAPIQQSCSVPTERFYVINTKPSTHPGQHWVAVYLQPKSSAYYFDPYGQPPSQTILKALRKCKRIRVWKRRLQGLQPVCGLYCLCFALALQNRLSLSIFGKNVFKNDELVKQIVQKHFG